MPLEAWCGKQQQKGCHVAAWWKCRLSSSPSTPESESAFYQVDLLQRLVDFPRGRDAAEHGGQNHHLTLVVERLVTYLALWLGSFICKSLFNPENHPLKQAFLQYQKSCH